MKLTAAMLMVLPLWACAKQGTFESAGENIDDTVEDVREAVEDVTDDTRDRRQRR